MQQQHIITRRALYDLVWSEPMIKLAKRFQMSDTGLRKICINANIPLPAAGYWIKLKFRKKGTRRIPFPQNYQGNQTITIRPVGENIKKAYKSRAAQNELANTLKEEDHKYITVPEKLIRPDKVIVMQLNLMLQSRS